MVDREGMVDQDMSTDDTIEEKENTTGTVIKPETDLDSDKGTLEKQDDKMEGKDEENSANDRPDIPESFENNLEEEDTIGTAKPETDLDSEKGTLEKQDEGEMEGKEEEKSEKDIPDIPESFENNLGEDGKDISEDKSTSADSGCHTVFSAKRISFMMFILVAHFAC